VTLWPVRCQHCDDGIKHHKYRIFQYLFVHIVCVCNLYAYKSTYYS
jgi:hypothetical protein